MVFKQALHKNSLDSIDYTQYGGSENFERWVNMNDTS